MWSDLAARKTARGYAHPGLEGDRSQFLTFGGNRDVRLVSFAAIATLIATANMGAKLPLALSRSD